MIVDREGLESATGKGVRIGILDTGVASALPCFNGSIVANTRPTRWASTSWLQVSASMAASVPSTRSTPSSTFTTIVPISPRIAPPM